MANILVTGAAGYIGSHVCKALKQRGHTPIGFDDLSRGYLKAVKFGPFIRGRLHDYEKIKDTIIEHHVEAVIHLAAFAYVEESTRFPEIYFENNINGTYWLLEAMNASGTRKIVFSSSCAVYGEALTELISEEHPCRPINPYGLSKLLCEKLIENQRSLNNFQICSLRYFNVAGADPEGELGENHDPDPHIIPKILLAARQQKTLSVFGTDYPTPDGSCIRDFIHVWDLALAHVYALERMLVGQPLQQTHYNLGGNGGISVLDLIHKAQDLLQQKIEIHHKERRPGDPAQLIASNEKFCKEMDWKPKHSDLHQILESAFEWQRKTLSNN